MLTLLGRFPSFMLIVFIILSVFCSLPGTARSVVISHYASNLTEFLFCQYKMCKFIHLIVNKLCQYKIKSITCRQGTLTKFYFPLRRSSDFDAAQGGVPFLASRVMRRVKI